MQRMSMSESRYVVGIDGGGTSTIAWLADVRSGNTDFRIAARHEAAASNPQVGGFENTFDVIRHTVDSLFARIAMPVQALDAVCLSLAGAGRPEDRQRISDWFASQEIARRVLIVGDAETLFAAGVEDSSESAVALIAGTGSMAWGRDHSGKTARSGGWGYLLGDEGSAFAIGNAALRSVVRMADGRTKKDRMFESILAHLRFSSADQMVPWCYADEHPRGKMASLAKLVFELAQDGVSPSAERVVRKAANQLAELVVGVARQLDLKDNNFTLVGTGSVLVQQPEYCRWVLENLGRQDLNPVKLQLVAEPVRGALKLAAALADDS